MCYKKYVMFFMGCNYDVFYFDKKFAVHKSLTSFYLWTIHSNPFYLNMLLPYHNSICFHILKVLWWVWGLSELMAHRLYIFQYKRLLLFYYLLVPSFFQWSMHPVVIHVSLNVVCLECQVWNNWNIIVDDGILNSL